VFAVLLLLCAVQACQACGEAEAEAGSFSTAHGERNSWLQPANHHQAMRVSSTSIFEAAKVMWVSPT
jgi:hypothetical protein